MPGYLEWKAKGAPVAFVIPEAGLPATPETWGLPTNGPHPNAARLFLDWLLSPVGQKAIGDYLYLHSIRADAPPPPGGLPISQIAAAYCRRTGTPFSPAARNSSANGIA